MRLELDNGELKEIGQLTLDDWRLFMSRLLRENSNSATIWDIMACVRGPDYPSERKDQESGARAISYNRRRQRKKETVEVIRHAMFFGMVGGSARSRSADKVKLPPQSEWDHFDGHVKRAATPLGLEIKTKTKKTWEDSGYTKEFSDA